MDNNLMFSSKDNEHYTPLDLLFKVVSFYDGMFDLDPCSNSKTIPNTPSLLQYTIEDDGLLQPWFGKVFVNPPYGGELKNWSLKAKSEYLSGNCSDILFLAPSRTETAWYRELIQFDRLNFSKRLKFQNPNNKGNSALFPSVLFYLGKRHLAFEDCFASEGEILFAKAKSRREYMRRYYQKKRHANTLKNTSTKYT